MLQPNFRALLLPAGEVSDRRTTMDVLSSAGPFDLGSRRRSLGWNHGSCHWRRGSETRPKSEVLRRESTSITTVADCLAVVVMLSVLGPANLSSRRPSGATGVSLQEPATEPHEWKVGKMRREEGRSGSGQTRFVCPRIRTVSDSHDQHLGMMYRASTNSWCTQSVADIHVCRLGNLIWFREFY